MEKLIVGKKVKNKVLKKSEVDQGRKVRQSRREKTGHDEVLSSQ